MASETVAQRVKRLRLERGLSQRELAVPGVSYAYISRIEAGTRTPSVKALRRLAEKLGVSAEFLENGAERTATDALAESLHRTEPANRAPRTRPRSQTPSSRLASVTFQYGTEGRTTHGACLTEALHEAVTWHVELERLRVEREKIEEAERALVACA